MCVSTSCIHFMGIGKNQVFYYLLVGFLKTNFIFNFSCMYVSVYVWVQCVSAVPTATKRGQQILQSWSYRCSYMLYRFMGAGKKMLVIC